MGRDGDLAIVFFPYVVLCALGPGRLRWLARIPSVMHFLERALSEERAAEPIQGESARAVSGFDMLSAVPALVCIILGSVLMVHGAQALGKDFSISDVIMGTIVLAALTGVPNVVVALRLAAKNQGAAVISEAFNSNSLNIAIGIFLPAWLIGLGAQGAAARVSTYWLIGLTVVSAILAARACGLSRKEGWLVIAGFAAFVVILVGVKA